VNDGCRIRDSLIAHNYCHDTLGSEGGSRAGFQVKVDTILLVFPSKSFHPHRLAHSITEFVIIYVTK
jgi:hypothetical protein